MAKPFFFSERIQSKVIWISRWYEYKRFLWTQIQKKMLFYNNLILQALTDTMKVLLAVIGGLHFLLRRSRPVPHQDGGKPVHVWPSYCHLASVVQRRKLEISHHILSGDLCFLVHRHHRAPSSSRLFLGASLLVLTVLLCSLQRGLACQIFVVVIPSQYPIWSACICHQCWRTTPPLSPPLRTRGTHGKWQFHRVGWSLAIKFS